MNATLFDVTTLSGALFYAAVIVVLAWIVATGLGVIFHDYLDKAEAAGTDSTSVRFLGQLIKILVYVIAFAFYAYLIPSLHSLGTAWIASVGLFSVIIGLATQSTLSTLIAGISVILYRPFRIGDRIQVTTPAGPEIGVVESIDLGYTSLRAPDGRRVVLPNSIIASQTNINFSRNLPHILWEESITVCDADDIDRVRTILLDTAKTLDKIEKINGCFVTQIGAAGTTLMLSTMCRDPQATSRASNPTCWKK